MIPERPTQGRGRTGMGIALPAVVAVAILGAAFLAVAGHTFSSVDFTEFLAVWGLVSVVGTVLSGLEWEASRSTAGLANRPANRPASGGYSSRPFLAVSLMVSGGAGAVMVVVLLWAVPAILHGSWLAAGLILVAVAGIPFQAATRGMLAGVGRVGTYSAILIAEVAVRLILVPLLLLSDAGVVAWIAALAAGSWVWVVIAPGTLLGRRSTANGPAARAIVSKFSVLLVGSLSYATLLMAYPTLLAAVDSDQHPQYVGAMGSAIVMSRLPALLVLPLLPLLIAFFVRHGSRGTANRSVIAALFGAIAAVVGVGVLLGPMMLRIVFGDQYALSGLTFGVLLLTCLLLVVSSVLSSDLVAHGRHLASSASWLAGALTTLAILVVVDANVGVLYPGALLVGSVLSFLLMALGLWRAGQRSIGSRSAWQPEGRTSGTTRRLP